VSRRWKGWRDNTRLRPGFTSVGGGVKYGRTIQDANSLNSMDVTMTDEQSNYSTEQSRVRTRRFLLGLAGVTLLALVLRLAAGIEMARTPAVRSPSSATDMATYARLAEDVRHGRFPQNEGDHPREFYYQPFYYTCFLPLVHAVFGSEWWGVMVVQAVIGAVTVWWTGLLAARLFGRRAGIWAALALALYRTHIFYTPFRLMAVVAAAALVLWVLLTARAWRKNRTLDWVWAAFGASVGTLLRGNFLLLMPAVPVLAAWRNRKRPRRAAALVLLTIALWYAPQLPFALVNFKSRGYWTGPSTAADAVLALGNTPEAPAGGLAYPPAYEEWTAAANRPMGERVPVSRRILAWIQREPLAWAELKFRTFLLFWWSAEIPNNVALAREGEASAVVRSPLLFGFGLLGALAVAGMLETARGHRGAPLRLFLLFCVWMYCAATVLFYMLARFRAPAAPLLAVYAGAAVDGVWRTVLRAAQAWTSETRSAVGRWVLYLGFGVVFVNWGYPAYHTRLERTVVRIARPYGVQVRVGRSWRVYDHGPLLLGGWDVIPLPTSPLVVEKTFRLRPEVAAAVSARGVRLRIPLYSATPARVRVFVDGDCSPPAMAAVDVDGKGLSWKEFAIDGVPVERGTLRFRVRFDGVGAGDKVGLPCDTSRWYGRTSFETSAREWSAPQGEACFELILTSRK